jgi:hypothetical protein
MKKATQPPALELGKVPLTRLEVVASLRRLQNPNLVITAVHPVAVVDMTVQTKYQR